MLISSLYSKYTSSYYLHPFEELLQHKEIQHCIRQTGLQTSGPIRSRWIGKSKTCLEWIRPNFCANSNPEKETRLVNTRFKDCKRWINPPASEASRELANLTEIKKIHTPVNGVKEFVCLSVRL